MAFPDGAGRAGGRIVTLEAPCGPYYRFRRMTVRSRTLDIKLRWIKTRRAQTGGVLIAWIIKPLSGPTCNVVRTTHVGLHHTPGPTGGPNPKVSQRPAGRKTVPGVGTASAPAR